MTTVARVAREMLDDPNLSERTRQIYTERLRHFLNEHGFWNVSDVTRDEVHSFLSRWDGAKHRTYNLSYSIVSRLFNFALKQGYIEQNPVSRLARRKPIKAHGETKQEAISYLSREQVEGLLRASRSNLRLLSVLHMLYDSGARIAEVLALDLRDVDFGHGEFLVVGKGNKQRTCYFRPSTGTVLRHYLERGREPGVDAFFTERRKRSAQVRRLTYHTVYAELLEITAQSDTLQGVSFHQLRHTFATERANQIPIESLKALLGHESIATTQIYQKVTSKVAKAAALDAFAKLAQPRS
jgi:integrase/recombinase XerD